MGNSLFPVFLWKNYLFLKFSWLPFIIINAACLTIVGVYLKTTHNVSVTPSETYEVQDIESIKLYFPGNTEDLILYSPTNKFVDDLMEMVRTELQLPTERIVPFKNSSDMFAVLERNRKTNSFAVHFENWLNQEGSKILRYSISSPASTAAFDERLVNDRDVNRIIVFDEYIQTGFLVLQHVIDFNLIRLKNHRDIEFDVHLSPLPSIEFETMDGNRINTFGSLFAALLNVLLLTTTLIPLVEERHDGIKEFLILATPFNWIDGFSFFLIRFLGYLPFIFGCTGMAYAFGAMGFIPLEAFLILLLLYSLAAMSYAFLISVCFKSVFYAKVGGFLLLIFPCLFHLVEGTLTNVAATIFCTTTFLKGLNVFQTFTNKHRIFSIADLFMNITTRNYTVFHILMLLLCQGVLYVLIYNYISRVFPGKGGLKRSPLFFLKPNFYKRKNRNNIVTGNIETVDADDVAISIQNLVKTFKTGNRKIKIADRLNMEIKDRRITVLLGHNGAGKTTTLNMIIGCVSKDAGKIIVCSERDVASYRHLIGFCPQHSVFMQYMTCYQHLTFFAQLRGKSRREANSIASELLTQLRLENKANEHGKNLSGGMKRRLSLGIALCGDTKVIILDEPSSGLDVESRRELWDIILEVRKAKAVLITTHHMEEAEVLGDTISILANGKLQQTGTPLELKRRLGNGYILKLRTDDQFQKENTMNLIRTFIPTASIVKVIYPTVLINMPYSDKDKYVDVLEKLEENLKALGIYSIAVTDTSLEDVFLNCQGQDCVDAIVTSNHDVVKVPYQKLVPDAIKWTRHMRAIFYKKSIYMRNQWLYTLLMLSLPFWAIGLALIAMTSVAYNISEGDTPLDLNHLRGSSIYLKVPPDFQTLETIFKNEIQRYDVEIRNFTNNPPIEEFLEVQKRNLYDFYEHVIGAIIVDSNEGKPVITMFYSTNAIHSSVIMVNLVDNALLKYTFEPNSSIETIYKSKQRTIDVNPSSLEYFASIVPIGFFFYMLFYVNLPFLENKNKFKNLQAIPRVTYWSSFVLFDIMVHLIVCAGCYVFQHFTIPTIFYGNDYQLLIVGTYFWYGVSYLPILYCFTITFRSISSLSTYLFFMLITSSIIPFITSNNAQSMERFQVPIVFLSLLPDFSFNHQLRVINENFLYQSKMQQKFKLKSNSGQLELPSCITYFVFAIFVFIVVQSFLMLIWDNLYKRKKLKKILCCCYYKLNSQTSSSPDDDEDEPLVRAERTHIDDILASQREESYPLLVKNLHKFYGKIHAVRGINFAVKKQECFGLLGINGAGKTSTFQMITANSTLSNGLSMIDGTDIVKNEDSYRYRFGYCPQGDCLDDFMTSYEMLKYMALLRNVDTDKIQKEVKYWISEMDLRAYENMRIRHYSGGTKRKLSAAVAMIGSPSVVFLDEPTTGVDPLSRRFLWRCIQFFQKREKTVVLTSHSMDECEQLCNRLAIMANGKLQCIGHIPDLKQKYGSGFTIKVKLSSNNLTDNTLMRITAAFREKFGCELREHHAGILTYFVNDKTIEWSEIFRRVESLMGTCNGLIEDYSINETTLEDIFLKFDRKCRKDVEQKRSLPSTVEC